MNQNRYSYASHDYNLPSRFIDELPKDIVDINDSSYIQKDNFLKTYVEDDYFKSDIISPGRQRLINNSKKTEIEWDMNQDFEFNEINAGEKVYHKKFGYGKILKLDLDKALVDFENFFFQKNLFKIFKIHLLIFDKKFFSSIILIPRDLAFSFLEPALSPRIKKSVFLLKLDKILAPLSFARYFASSLESLDNVPVKTKFLFEKKLLFLISFGLLIRRISSNLFTVLIFFSLEKYSIKDEIALGPKPSIF